MAKRRVLVVGYPKSGNTWLTRLTAELLGAPVKGFWREPQSFELAVEGSARSSEIEVYKGHQPYAVVRRDFSLANVIYIVRDVRDVAVSAAHYFSFRPPTRWGRLCYVLRRLTPKGRDEVLESLRLRQMLHALADGDAKVNPWCGRAWDEHVGAYLDAGAFVVRYEDLLTEPERECRRLLRHLAVQRPPAAIRAAVANQTFDSAKKRFLLQGDLRRATFLREGHACVWPARFTVEQNSFCLERFRSTLSRLDYGPIAAKESAAGRPPARSRAHARSR